MFNLDDRILVAVSGGKDSLALWDILLELGYDVDGLFVNLGIGDYSSDSGQFAWKFAKARGLKLRTIDLRSEFNFDILTGSRAARRAPCSACGLTKRHLFDDAALSGNYNALATGHNLDDEAAVLLGNVLRWEHEYLGRQRPVLQARGGFPKKVKPLVRLAERETAAYCILRGIEYMLEECPMAEGNRHLAYKEALNGIEDRSPGAKHSFYFGFQDRGIPLFAMDRGPDTEPIPCERCGASGNNQVCAFCRLLERTGGNLPTNPVSLNIRRARPAANGHGGSRHG